MAALRSALEVDRYLEGLLIQSDPGLDAAAQSSNEGRVPAHQVSAVQGKLLHLLARMCGARVVLELGTLGGYSTIWLARALPAGGRVVTLEADPAYAEVARANVDRAGAGDAVEIVVGRALETLPRLDGPFDFVFLDAHKRSNPDYPDWALRLSRPGTAIVADNVVRGGAVADPESDDPNAPGLRGFTEMLATDPRIDATAIQTVGAKGWDGFVL